MGLLGTVIGGLIGGMIGNLPGILIGAGLGAYITRDQPQNGKNVQGTGSQMPDKHLVSLFRCLGKLAKADGLVSQDEADFAKSL